MIGNNAKTDSAAGDEAAAREFDRIASEVFAPIYPVIAEQIAERTGITKGRCLDVGTGGGHLGLEVAKLFDGEIVLLDRNPCALRFAKSRIADRDRGRITTAEATVRNLPFADESFSLVVSRGSMQFWEDREKSIKEIWRVLARDGAAYMGGGFGSLALRDSIECAMTARGLETGYTRQERLGKPGSIGDYTAVLDRLGITTFQRLDDGGGDWILLRKNRKPAPAAAERKIPR
jgi:ubiquinone/menaquinone biosynthesis C-methylase UbiE